MDHTPDIKPAGAKPAPSGHNRACAECLGPVTSVQPGALFCSQTCRNDFQDRMRVRGRQLVPLELAVMVTRHGRRGDKDAGVRAARSAQRLKRRWIEEDRNAGRMPMDQYIRRLLKHHDLPI